MQRIREFFRSHKALLPLMLAALLPFLIVIPALHLTRHFWTSKHEAAATLEVPEYTVIITEPPTEPTTVPITTEPTEPPTTEPPAPPESCIIEDVPYYSQHGLLPTGCELVSAKMLLEYYTGTPVDIQDIIDRVDCQYPQSVNGVPCAPHPSEAFIGSPWDPTSFGCFAPIICDMMNDLLPDDYMAVETTGTPLSELAETYIPQGRPVLVWATIGMCKSSPYLGWYLSDEHCLPTDEWYDWLVNEHCLVLVGYDADYYYFNDPYAWGTGTRYGRELVEMRYEEMSRYSAVVLDNPEHIEPETLVATRETLPETTEEELTNPPMPEQGGM